LISDTFEKAHRSKRSVYGDVADIDRESCLDEKR